MSQGKESKQLVAHVDMDAFFAAVEQLDRPELRGKPVIVGADPRDGRGRGVVSTASYEARTYGVHSALPISIAYKRCPHGIFVPPRMGRYVEVSNTLMVTLRNFSPTVEPVSIDEAFLDVSGMKSLFGSPHQLAVRIKQAILQATGVSSSVGIASSKYVAKVASDLRKPDGLVIVDVGTERAFLASLDIERLWGIGKKTAPLLRGRGYRTIGDVAAENAEILQAFLGSRGLHIWHLANGLDDRPVRTGWQRKSMSEETTFSDDVSEDSRLRATIHTLADTLGERLRSENLQGKVVSVKIRLAPFSTFTRRLTLPGPVSSSYQIRAHALALWQNFPRGDRSVRLIGIGLSGLTKTDDERQLSLFGPPPRDNRRLRAEKTSDRLRILGSKVKWGGFSDGPSAVE